MKDYFVYILANWDGSVVYTGVTNNLERRLHEHRAGHVRGFASKYKTTRLVYFEQTSDPSSAITREKQIKSWRRNKKNALVATLNPEWKDLSLDWTHEDPSGCALGMTGG